MINKITLIEWLTDYLEMEVTEETIFLKDLPYEGIEIHLFFDTFFKKFGIDCRGFDLSDYTLDAIGLLAIWFKGKKALEFNVDHLIKVIRLKKWYDPNKIDYFINKLNPK